ncbi:MAG: D-hexose-6-phosphate mutarotase [Lentisphaeria bacterium]|nr:D-hexose-6-phosphate mutarotase [Lentisphaeria bacterium]
MNDGISSTHVRRAEWRDTGLPTLEITNRYGSGVISLYGAHLLSWIPAGGREVLMLSEKSEWQLGEPIRGGVPICWPWFGGSAKPSHGIARRHLWELLSVTTGDDDSDTVTMAFETTEPHPLRATFAVNFGASLKMTLTSLNRGEKPWVVATALHTYFDIADIAGTTLTGLENQGYLNTVGGFNECPGSPDPIVCNSETDRVYHSAGDVILTDRTGNRSFRIAKTGSDETVVWNPWVEKSSRMPDFGDDEYRRMICVEAANIPGIRLDPGQAHTLSQIITPL